MDCIKKEFVRTDADGHKWWRVVLTATEAPDSLQLTGADVAGMDDNIRFESGSVLLTPSANYIAFEDGVFTQKGGGSPTPSEGITVTIINQSGDKVDVSYMEEIGPGSATWVTVNDSSTEIISDLSSGIYFYFDSIDDQQITATGEYTTVTEHGATLYQCSGNVTFTVISK